MHKHPFINVPKILSFFFLSILIFSTESRSADDVSPLMPTSNTAPELHPSDRESAASQSSSYFYFSSSYDPLVSLKTPQAKSVLANYKSVIVGIDASGDTRSSEFKDKVRRFRDSKWRVHVYLEGPGGPTGSGWSRDECERVQKAARIYGRKPIPKGDTCKDDNAEWMKEWNESVFFKQLQQQLKDLKNLGVESVEVDNLNRAGYGADKKSLAEFIKRFKAGKEPTNSIKLLLKNVSSPAELDAIMTKAPREAVADYMIVEEDWKDQWCSLQSAGKKYGIVSAFSWDTSDYHAESDNKGKDLVFSGPAQSQRKKFSCLG